MITSYDILNLLCVCGDVRRFITCTVYYTVLPRFHRITYLPCAAVNCHDYKGASNNYIVPRFYRAYGKFSGQPEKQSDWSNSPNIWIFINLSLYTRFDNNVYVYNLNGKFESSSCINVWCSKDAKWASHRAVASCRHPSRRAVASCRCPRGVIKAYV